MSRRWEGQHSSGQRRWDSSNAGLREEERAMSPRPSWAASFPVQKVAVGRHVSLPAFQGSSPQDGKPWVGLEGQGPNPREQYPKLLQTYRILDSMSKILSGGSDFQPLLGREGLSHSRLAPGPLLLIHPPHSPPPPSQLQLPSMLPPLRTLSCLALSWGGERRLPDQSPV